MKEKFVKAVNGFTSFVQSDWMLGVDAALVMLGWGLKLWVWFLPVLILINTLPLFFAKGTRHLLPVLMMFSLIISDSRHQLNDFAPLLALVALLFVGMIFNVIRFKPSFAPLKPSNIKGFHCALIALIVPFALGGVGSPSEHPLAVVAALALILLCGVGYSYLTVTNADSEQKKELPEYMLKTLVLMGVIIFMQLVIYYGTLGNAEQIRAAILAKNIQLGWAGPNNVAPTLSMCIPATLYFCIKKSKISPLFTLLAVAEYALLFTTGCRGAILFTTIALPVCILYVMAKTENKLAFGVTLSLCIAVGAVLIAYFGNSVAALLDTILKKGLNSSGRIEHLYPEALEAFKKWPVFGAGWDYKLGELAGDSYSPYWYHSTALQIIANMGIVGAITFVFFYFWRYRTFIAMRKDSAALALMVGLGLFDAYGMVDTNFFGPTFFIMLLGMTLVVEVNIPEDKCRAFAGRDPFKAVIAACKRTVISIKTRSARKHAGVVGYSRSADESAVPAAPAHAPENKAAAMPETSEHTAPDERAEEAETTDDAPSDD